MLYVSHSSGKGRGVFSNKKIQRETIIERCPVLELPPEQLENIDQTELYNYYFSWGKEMKAGALALGLGSIYNHSYTPNALYRLDMDDGVIEFLAIKNIPANEEITINYNGSPMDQSPLWGKIDWQK
ncbi:SET domain-containing protein-lysine N-methyltransferase [Endozoicomonas sp. OPT23]|uniref:SET domain-containing protein n=1 Tax=Endozoicomonas sp. OPT23 TaxID=2072845 RepID=UPI00129BF720|nr:SET domain-containing protein [Endozoicomonas sp. OPT23]MRI31864.1 SET domain-containing protein-lysine N-methyltransferase [Endozoicomonas sp. OPT23]